MRLYNSLTISIITYSSVSWTLNKALKKRLDAFNTKALPYCGRPLRLRHERLDSQPHRTTPSNNNNPQTAPIGAFGHIILCRLQTGTQAIPGGRPPLRWADQIIKDTQMSLSDAVIATHDRPSWRPIVRGATCPATLTT